MFHAEGEVSRPEDDYEDDSEIKGKSDIDALIETIQQECAHVYDDPDTSEKLEQLLFDAQEFYKVDPAGWENLLKKTKQRIAKAEDDFVAIKDILREALTEATTELM